MSTIRPAVGLAALGALFLASAAIPAGVSREVTSIWDINASGRWTEPREVAKGEPLIELDIVPPGLIEIMDDLPDVPLRQGDLLYRLSWQSGAVYCTVDAQPMIANENKFAHTMLICLVDGNGDGTFEGHIRRRAAAGVPLIFGEIPSRLQPVPAVRYEQRQPSSIAGAFKLRILLDSDPAKAKQLKFAYSAGDPKGEVADTMKLATVTEVANRDYPQSFEILGGLFELTGVKDGKAVVRMIAPTSDYPFMVEPGTVKL
jgi:hypothetical protein